ncbi:hypothetical protein ASZ90_001764 [hydrocarbon metagenome]|uniref:Acyltransferase 3 domain-containing protein n=1 Tax=hydrocarbon metagenome TaxID=938273 RepID=A0A0W8G5C3_9ZZZZ
MTQGRMLYVDNTRLSLIVLVLFVHAVVTYSGVGGWYYRDPAVPGPSTLLFFVFIEGFCQSFFMGTLFALAGYYAALALGRKGTRAFVMGRLTRLGLPSLFFMAVVNPLTVYYLAGMENLQARISFAGYYRHYVTGLYILSGSGPMWFALALLLFCLIYAWAAALTGSPPRAGEPRPLTARLLAGLILACTAGAFSIRLVMPIGATLYNMQLGYFTQYVVLFAFGIAAQANDWLRTADRRLGRACLATVCAGLPVWGGLLLFGTGGDIGALAGGPHWQSLAYALWESTNGVCMTVGIVTAFREKWNTQGRLVAALSASAFAVYVFHPPIMVALARVLAPLSLPVLVKCLALFALSLPACFGAAWIIRRSPLVREMVRQ